MLWKANTQKSPIIPLAYFFHEKKIENQMNLFVTLKKIKKETKRLKITMKQSLMMN